MKRNLLIALRSWVERILALSMVLLGLTVFSVAGPAGATTTGTGSCTINYTGTATPTPPDLWGETGVNGTIGCTGLTSATYEDFGVVINGITWWLSINPTSYHTNIATSFTCTITSGAIVPGGTCDSTIGGGSLVTSTYPNNGSLNCANPSTVTTPSCGVDAYDANIWENGVTLTYTSSISGYTYTPSCNPLSQSGFYSTTATGSNSYSFTYTYSGTTDEIVGDPGDTVGAVTIHGKSFSTDYGADTSPSGGSSVVTVTPARGTDPNEIEFWCWDGGSWYDWGNALSGGSTGPGGGPACVLVAAVLPFESSSGGTFGYTFQTAEASGDYAVVLDPDDGASGTPYSVPGTTSKTFPSDSVFWQHGNGQTSVTLTATIASGSDNNDVKAWCFDYTLGTWTEWADGSSGAWSSGSGTGTVVPTGGVNPAGPGGTGTTGNGGGGFSLASCMAAVTADFSWNVITDVLQVVTGGVEMLSCLVQYLVLPSQSTWSDLTNEFGLGASPVCSGSVKATISQFFGCAVGGVVVAPAADVVAIKAAADGGSCASVTGGSTNLTIAGQSTNACSLLADTGSIYYSGPAASSLSVVALLETIAVYVLAALALIFLLRDTLRGKS